MRRGQHKYSFLAQAESPDLEYSAIYKNWNPVVVGILLMENWIVNAIGN